MLPIVGLIAASCGHATPSPVARTTPLASVAPRSSAVVIGGAPLDAGAPNTVCASPTTFESQELAARQPPAPGDVSAYVSGESRLQSSPDTCGVADDNLKAAEDAILGQAAPGGAPSPRASWDKKTPPLYLDRIARRYPLDADATAMLAQNGFVVAPRHVLHSFGWQMHETFQSELPLYVSADSLFHAVYVANDSLMASLEQSYFVSVVDEILTRMYCTLPTAAASYPPDVARDLDVYIAVARSFTSYSPPEKTQFGSDPEVAQLYDAAMKATGIGAVTLFGRPRMIDWSQYMPRGHYASDGTVGRYFGLDRYFRVSMWLSRLELNLVSRSSRSSQPGETPNPEETPREAIDALALADLADRAGVTPLIAQMDRAWGAFAGKREDVSIAQLGALRKKAQIDSLTDPQAFAKLKAAIGNDYQRTARVHWMPQGSSVLPAITTMFGPRIVADTTATRALVHDEISSRYMLHSFDMAYAFGDDRAKQYLKSDLAAFPKLGKQLDVARGLVQGAKSGGDLYAGWASAIRVLAKRAPSVTASTVVPSFMETGAYGDMHLDSVIAAFGQLRHNNVLVVAQGYDAYGCEIPDGWVEPLPDAYEALAQYAENGATAVAAIDPHDRAGGRRYFTQVARLMRVMRAIALSELGGRPLSTDERRFLAMVAEHIPHKENCDSCPPPMYTGWWFDLFISRVSDGLSGAAFMADFYTSTNDNAAMYIGATRPRLGVFVVDTGGPPRAFVGPVSHAFEVSHSLDQRLTDADAETVTGVNEPWSSSYTAKVPQEPSIAVSVTTSKQGDLALVAQSTGALGPVTIELLDHHRVPFAHQTQNVGAAPTRFVWPASVAPERLEGFAVTVGAYREVWAASMIDWSDAELALGTMRPPPATP